MKLASGINNIYNLSNNQSIETFEAEFGEHQFSQIDFSNCISLNYIKIYGNNSLCNINFENSEKIDYSVKQLKFSFEKTHTIKYDFSNYQNH